MRLPSELIGRFRLHLVEARREAQELHARARAGPDAEAVEALRALAHKLAGTAGAFGQPRLGDLAHGLEAEIKADALWDARLEAASAAFVRALDEALDDDR